MSNGPTTDTEAFLSRVHRNAKRDNIDISELISHVRDGSFTPDKDVSTPVLTEYERLTVEADADIDNEPARIWHKTKPERNARVALILQAIWPRFKMNSELIVKGLDADKSNLDVHGIPSIRNGFVRYLKMYIDNPAEFASNEKEADIAIHSFARLNALVRFGARRLMWNSGEGEGVDVFILRGFNTATSASINYLLLAVQIMIEHKLPFTKETLEAIVRKNARHLMIFARMNIEHGPRLLDTMRNTAFAMEVPYKKRYFTFDKDTLLLTPDMKLLDTLPEHAYADTTILDIPPSGETPGCPASYFPTILTYPLRLYTEIVGNFIEHAFSDGVQNQHPDIVTGEVAHFLRMIK